MHIRLPGPGGLGPGERIADVDMDDASLDPRSGPPGPFSRPGSAGDSPALRRGRGKAARAPRKANRTEAILHLSAQIKGNAPWPERWSRPPCAHPFLGSYTAGVHKLRLL